ncbi:hypothetical protein BDW59DRAFT_175625 [Aspergillus cavernicola]|uniref:F-box domain-containing protein n=1 Tax=Aspergillus cavernicola TaxID=176166 RepID=A0ABR4HNF3_9EURO
MSSVASPIELLPNELLDEIISLLSTPPPSSNRLHQRPSDYLTKSSNRDLKSVSLTSPRLLDLVRPRLFSHSCLKLKDVNEYLSFISGSGLDRYVTSIVMKASDVSNHSEGSGPLWWRSFLCSLRPRRLIVVAPPSFMGRTLGMQIPDEHGWAFEIPLQVLQLECDWRDCKPSLASQMDQQSSLLDCLPWSSMLFNESSSLKAYNHYEYFLYQVPSLFHRWSTLALSGALPEQPHLSLSLGNLSAFTYVAVFPFYNHVQRVLDAIGLMTNLRSLKVQLGPFENDRVTELEQRGSMDPSDPWMELATGYSLIAHAVWFMGRDNCLAEFTACDYEMEAVRAEIDMILMDVLCHGPWTHNGHGTWTKRPMERAEMDIQDKMPTTTTAYNFEPAEPILAHSLLQPPGPLTPGPNSDSTSSHKSLLEPNPSDAWNLKLDIEQGLHSSPDHVFRPGTVIGFSRLRGRAPEGNEDEFVGELPRYLLTTWLRQHPPGSSTLPTPQNQNRVFIIHPANSTIFAPEKLLASLLLPVPHHQYHPSSTATTTITLSRNQAISHLDSVHLFPVFDFAAAVQAIANVSDTLRQPSSSPNDNDNDNDNIHSNQSNHPTLFIIVGLDTLTEAVIRASNAVRGTAVLSSALRTLTHLSRTHCPYLSVLLVNTSGVGPMIGEDSGGAVGGRFSQTQTQTQGQTQREYETGYSARQVRVYDDDDGNGIQSMFRSVADTSLFPSLLMRTLDQGIDTHLLVSNSRRKWRRGSVGVEVVKDRVGSGGGKWCVLDMNG